MKCDIIILLCSCVISITTNLYPQDMTLSIQSVLQIFFGIIIHFFILKICFRFLEHITVCSIDSKVDFKIKLRCYVLLACIFLLPLIIYYPGVNGWDTEYQLVDFFDGTQVMHRESWGGYYVPYTLSDHMNLFDTLLFGFFVKHGMLLGDATIGVFVYCVLQALFFAYVCTCLLIKLSEWGVNRKIVTISFFFYALLPFIWMYSINMIKATYNNKLEYIQSEDGAFLKVAAGI